MSQVTVDFEFEIGDLLYFRDAENSLDKHPRAFLVYERIAQECHGGIQRFYKLTGLPDATPEIALTKDAPKYSRRCAERTEEQIELLNLEAKASRVGWREYVATEAK
jgi:hypothetical protein